MEKFKKVSLSHCSCKQYEAELPEPALLKGVFAIQPPPIWLEAGSMFSLIRTNGFGDSPDLNCIEVWSAHLENNELYGHIDKASAAKLAPILDLIQAVDGDSADCHVVSLEKISPVRKGIALRVHVRCSSVCVRLIVERGFLLPQGTTFVPLMDA